MTRLVTILSNRREIELHTGQPNPYGNQWDAIDGFTYDCDFIGGEDDEWRESGGRGWGSTEMEAINELIDELEAA